MRHRKRIFCFFIICATLVSSYSYGSASAVNPVNMNTCKKVAAYIKKNTKKFAKEYNKMEDKPANKFKGTSVKKQIKVKLLDNNTTGIYLDFNKKNGYMVIASDGEVIDFEVSGNLTYLNNKKMIYYSSTEKFMYKNKKGDMISYKRTKAEKNATSAKKVYNGCDKRGRITNSASYVKDRYGKKYNLNTTSSLKNFPYTKQWDTSIYYTIDKNGGISSESNCSLNSIYAVLGYLQENKIDFSNLPSISKKSLFDATKENFYEKYSKKKEYDIKTFKELPVLYQEIRQYAIDKGYFKMSEIFEGTNPFQIKAIMKNVCKKYEIKPSISHKIFFDFKGQVKKEIDAGYPTIFNMSNHSLYKGHTVVVTGYKVYKKTRTILGIKITKKIQIMQVADNWDDSYAYIDYDAYNWPASFVKIRE